MKIRGLKYIGLGGAVILSALLPAACSTISESECVAGNWADLGYRDGVNGVERSRIAKYVEACSEYGASVNRARYQSSYEAGLPFYCTYDKGYTLGENGSSYRSVCDGSNRAALAADFRAGYEDGHAAYQVRETFDDFEREIHSREDALKDVSRRLKDSELAPAERKRLGDKRARLRSELDTLRHDFRRFKRDHRLY